MFGNQRQRLLRTIWPNAQLLAEELYAMMDDNAPVSSGPITFEVNPGEAPITFQGAGGDDPLFQFRGRSGEDLGDTTFNEVFNPATSGAGGGGGTPQTTRPIVTAALGKIINGSGTTYQLSLYLAGPTAGLTTVSATLISPDTDFDLPAGTFVNVYRISSTAPATGVTWFFQQSIPQTFPGTVTGGSGTTYQMDVFPFGLAGGVSKNVTVLQLQIDGSDTLPVGTKAMVSKMADGQYVMQVAVYLE